MRASSWHMNPEKSIFTYSTYILSPQEEVWKALTAPSQQRHFWFNCTVLSNWTEGSDWRILFDDGTIADTGKILEIEAPHRMVIDWHHQWQEDLKAEGPSKCTITLEGLGGSMKLTIIHEIDHPGSKFIECVAQGWPAILSGLKTWLELGKELPLPQE